ncbi:MAG: hypothetical protein RIR76_3238 [Verrucomicrobiota bacterium]|jgi:hypothetical protein|nr:hypothetical protein [Opitutaceae bacterium]
MPSKALPPVAFVLIAVLTGCTTTSSSESGESARPETEATASSESFRSTESKSAAEEDPLRQSSRERTTRTPAQEGRSETPTNTERAAARSALAVATSGGTADISRLVEQLREAGRELASLRAANARLRVEKARAEKSAQTAAESEEARRAREKTLTELKAAGEEMRKLRETVDRLGELLSEEKGLRTQAEATTAQLREELRTIARAVGELAVEPRSDEDRRRKRE